MGDKSAAFQADVESKVEAFMEARKEMERQFLESFNATQAKAEFAAASGAPLKPWTPVLEKLGVFGKLCKEGYNFEWPSKYLVEQWPTQRKIKLCRITTNWTSLRSIQIQLTPNLLSEEMAASEKGATNKEYMENTQGAPITEIGVKINGQMQIYGIKFIYATGDVHILFEGEGGLWKTRQIPAGKEIIGIYGNSGEDRIYSLGFIVWTPNPIAF